MAAYDWQLFQSWFFQVYNWIGLQGNSGISWEISKLEMLRSFKLCVLFVNNRSTISLFYDGSVDLISFVRDRTTFHDESWEFASWVYSSSQWYKRLGKVKNQDNSLKISKVHSTYPWLKIERKSSKEDNFFVNKVKQF